MSSGMWRYFPQLALTTIQKSLSVKIVTICGETNNMGSTFFFVANKNRAVKALVGQLIISQRSFITPKATSGNFVVSNVY